MQDKKKFPLKAYMIMNNPNLNPNMLQAQLHHDQRQIRSSFLSKHHD